MTEGWVLAIFIALLGLLVLVGIIDNALISRDDERRRRKRSDHARGRRSEEVL
jgi:hypothetical protein